MAKKIMSQSDALTAELMGVAKMTDVDAPPEEAKDPLEVAPQQEKPAVVTAAASKSTTGYLVKMKGIYFAHDPRAVKGKAKKEYAVEFRLRPEDIKNAMGVIVGKLLDPKLRATYPDYAAYQTHVIVEVIPLTKDTPAVTNLQLMSRDKLVAYIEAHNVPIDPSEPIYQDVVVLREGIIDFVYNPQDFAAREKKRLEDLKETLELKALNDIPA